MVRKFKLINEKGQEFSLMDIQNYCLLTDPDGLGYSNTTSYEKIGDAFIAYASSLDQKPINGTCNFINYDNYSSFVNFIENSQKISLSYEIPYKNQNSKIFYKDVKLQELQKAEIQQNGVLSCPITFDMLSLWYEKKEYNYNMGAGENEVRWDFRFSKSRWINYNQRQLIFDNTGHTEAAFKLELSGDVENPAITIQDENDNVLFALTIPIHINQYEKFIYSSIDGEIEISKENVDGTRESLFKQDYIDITKNNIFKLPQGVSKITISAEDEILFAKLSIFPFYKSM